MLLLLSDKRVRTDFISQVLHHQRLPSYPREKCDPRKKQSSFDAFAPYVLKRWDEGEHKEVTLYREIKALSYTGSDRSMYRYLATLKRTEIHIPINIERIKKYTPNTAVWSFVRDPKKLGEVEQEDLAAILLASPPP